jgi:crotonobetainyl-CoA:carnitine CoA-transferase CaiB-like acyl-CoA transferase
MMQAGMFMTHSGSAGHEPRGQQVLGSSALHRMYRAADGWLFLGIRSEDMKAFAAVPGLDGIEAVPPLRLAAFLEERLSVVPVAEWTARFDHAEIGCHRVITIAELMASPYVRARHLLLERQHPDGGIVATIGPVPRLSHTPVQPGRPLRTSQDAAEILDEIGFGDRVGDWQERGIIKIRPLHNSGRDINVAKAK